GHPLVAHHGEPPPEPVHLRHGHAPLHAQGLPGVGLLHQGGHPGRAGRQVRNQPGDPAGHRRPLQPDGGEGRRRGLGRGRTAYDHFYGDPTYPNPNLGKIERGPFYAVKLYPGDLGTKGGILTDEYARVLKDGVPIPGLYATGNCTASVMGRTYPGPGATLGPAVTFGYIAGKEMVKLLKGHEAA